MANSNRIKQIFNDTLELEPDEREKFLAENCGGDDELRREVESLLDSYNRVEDFLQTPVVNFSASKMAAQVLESEEASAIGKLVGAYKIEREIGRGGMGAVYLATRNDGQFHKKVAIKLLRRGTENELVVRRFQNERQILADLEHPNIARLIDGGTTENSLPYFVMEYVEGSPVNRFCDDRNLPIEERLKLFREICAAVEFAHEHSIIHRDIKPSNILVTKTGTPKLLDFGIAKTSAINETLNSTATALRVMTPEYASPEQMRGGTVTKVSDIYSLGVLLYELITGHRPYHFDSKSPYEIVQAICEEEPVRPSSIARSHSSVEKKRAIEPDAQRVNNKGRSTKLLNGDLDNIILKSLRKEPERRYASVRDFSEDVRRLLEGSPVAARQDTTFYHVVKFSKRHQTAFLSALAVTFIFLLAGFSLRFFNQGEVPNEPKAITSSETSNQNLPFEKQKGGSGNAEARNFYLVGQFFWNQRTHSSLTKALEYFRRASESDPEFALAYSGLSNTYFLLSVWGNIPAKEAFPKAKTASLKAISLAPDAPEGHLSLAIAHWLYEYDWQAADREFKRAIELNPNYARAPQWYGLFLAEMGKFNEAIAAEKRALEIEPHSAPVNADYARVLFYARRYNESAEQYRKTIEMNPSYEAFYSELIQLYEAYGKIDEWQTSMEKIGGFLYPSLKKAYQTKGITGYYREKIKSYDTQPNADWYEHYQRAEAYAQAGEPDRAFDSLNKAFEERDHRMAQLKVNPKLDNLCSEPRFTALLRRMNLGD